MLAKETSLVEERINMRKQITYRSQVLFSKYGIGPEKSTVMTGLLRNWPQASMVGQSKLNQARLDLPHHLFTQNLFLLCPPKMKISRKIFSFQVQFHGSPYHTARFRSRSNLDQ